ncbi:MAG TPA: hypothetical protein DCX54_01050 [Flavobacteriales bacterium]|nr:hypothetical protein [Flavobacteriales bacterium]
MYLDSLRIVLKYDVNGQDEREVTGLRKDKKTRSVSDQGVSLDILGKPQGFPLRLMILHEDSLFQIVIVTN